jgi:hypothetical protein
MSYERAQDRARISADLDPHTHTILGTEVSALVDVEVVGDHNFSVIGLLHFCQ